MRAKRVPFDKQLELIMECRASGLTDSQWCNEHNIKHSTFYTWIERHREAACRIPSVSEKNPVQRLRKQEVVKVEPDQLMNPVQPVDEASECRYSPVQHQPQYTPSMEIIIDNTVIRVTNDISPGLLAQTLHVLKGMSC